MRDLPQVTRVYRNHHLDSTRWEAYRPRPDDVIISTSYKSGTTWMQSILLNLVFGGVDAPTYWEASPWVGMRIRDLEERMALLEGQEHRRIIKSHLPLDGQPYLPDVKYVVVARDARDVFMSLWNHYSNYTDDFYEQLNTGQEGDPLPRIPADHRTLWRQWMTRGWFPWESDGYPFWGNLHHTKTWWEYRHLPNILFVHYNDLQRDLAGQIRRVADYLEMAVDDDVVARTVEATSFASMKARAIADDEAERAKRGMGDDDEFDHGFRGGETSFVFKGTNGRWRGVLDDDDLALHRAAVERLLPPGCARWLEHGWLA